MSDDSQYFLLLYALISTVRLYSYDKSHRVCVVCLWSLLFDIKVYALAATPPHTYKSLIMNNKWQNLKGL